mmetsp:Transcript_30149/g.69115  ORF Transcript_30149/g.69115 Transcript_30149/m.69115 type:complete len:169 (-) Transcript_30149:95-601(-)|eukprot:CAMPEP_0113303640 /NCGR_PEP_ID=MMETSP0010_2-20120614/3972_1 /TAXON_ID=216773 ORGANISM="Corethron hystrix, Strain 308" /NCGR_SAMPLE_ID=MMETSP0010_2 /ASSEMBLY_ACC=CAM_ASM_000155 /LENGTH=168 /DNA_ID=CAMNT_0000157671 /DNA_START=149 /DNA_END=655 /DNA_ORIENTATION=+ /assembly_acc=CAM_ASM_000155
MADISLESCPSSAPFFGFMGVTSALVFANVGAAYGSAKSGIGIASMGVMNPGLVMRNIIPVVMAGVLGIYGLIVAVIIQGSITAPQQGVASYSLYTGFANLAAGLTCGLSGLAAGLAIGIVGDAGVRAVGQQEKLFVGMILILIFAEALGLYGLIVALILSQNSYECP